MSNLIPFEECDEAIAILDDGKALTTFFVFDDNGPYKEYKNYYYDILGYDQGGGEAAGEYHIATILSEIGNMPEHYVVVGARGKTVSGLHGDMFYVDLDDFEEL